MHKKFIQSLEKNKDNFNLLISPELSEWLITEGYWKVMGRPSLSLKEREMCIFAMLRSMKYKSQLYSHINGALRLNNSKNNIKTLFLILEQTAGKNISQFGLRVFDSYLKKKADKGYTDFS